MVGSYGNEKCFSKNLTFKKSIISNANGYFLFCDNFFMNFCPGSIVRKTLKGRKKNFFSAKILSWFKKMQEQNKTETLKIFVSSNFSPSCS